MMSLPEIPKDATNRFRHILAAEEIWLSRLRGTTPRVTVWPEKAPEPSREWIMRNCNTLRDYLSGASLTTVVEYRTGAGALWRSQVSDVLLHILGHGNHHRGQIAMIVKAAGGSPAMTDYIFYTRDTPPE